MLASGPVYASPIIPEAELAGPAVGILRLAPPKCRVWQATSDRADSRAFGKAVVAFGGLACVARSKRPSPGLIRLSAKKKKKKNKSVSSRTFEVATTPESSDTNLRMLAKENAKLIAKLEAQTATVEDKKRLAKLNRELADLVETKADSQTAVREELAKRTEAVDELKTRRDGISKVLKQLTDSEKVDLLFLVDCTHSMSPHVSAVKQRINDITHNVMARSSALQMKIGFLGYRDIQDKRRFETFNFSHDHTAFKNFVSGVQVEGGGDGPEDIAGALKRAVDFGWASPTRVILHLADCPCHGSKYHGLRDDYPDGDPNGLAPEQLLRRLRDANVNYYFGKITGFTDQMIQIFNQAVSKDKEFVQVIPLTSLSNFTEEVSHSVGASIAATFMVDTGLKSMDGAISVELVKGKTKHVKIDKAQPSWKAMLPTEASVFATQRLRSMSDLKGKDLGLCAARPADAPGSRVWIKIAPHSFAAGANRYAHWAKMGMVSGKTSLHDRSIAVDWETMVAKQFKKDVVTTDVRARHLAQMENSMVASFLAVEYNKVKKPNHKRVEVLRSYVIHVGSEFYTIEKPLPPASEFLRFSSNSGFWNSEHYNPTLGEFSRWTLRATKGYLLVSDLQGVELPDRIVLTDPAILCEDLSRFGGTNLGPAFMERVLKSLNALERCV